MIASALVCLALHASPGEPAWVDARVTSTLQFFQQALVPGLPGAVTRVEPGVPLTLLAFTRFGGLGAGGGQLSGELSAWGRVGPLDGMLGDGDVTAAWVQYNKDALRVRLGRQVTLPGSSRYVRFDGLTLGGTLSFLDAELYGGWVALPRWSQARGAVLAGFAGDALRDPTLLEAQNRAGQFTYGARLTARGGLGRVALAFHEQRDLVGVAFRVVTADAVATPTERVTLGGRLTFATHSIAVSEARLYADVRTPWLPVSLDYSYQNSALLLPHTSVLAAFGGGAWHELGVEGNAMLLQSLKFSVRAAGQAFEGARLGGRGSMKLSWVPDLDQRVLLVAEAGRAFVPPSGFTFGRLSARGKLVETVWLSGDSALYVYDVAIRGHAYSLTGIASLEWAPFERVRGLLSGVMMTTPYSTFEVQALARLVFDLGTVREGSTP